MAVAYKLSPLIAQQDGIVSSAYMHTQAHINIHIHVQIHTSSADKIQSPTLHIHRKWIHTAAYIYIYMYIYTYTQHKADILGVCRRSRISTGMSKRIYIYI